MFWTETQIYNKLLTFYLLMMCSLKEEQSLVYFEVQIMK
jgi:hypothetical protein